MDYLMVLRFFVVVTLMLFAIFAVTDRYSFSYGSPTRRYRYLVEQEDGVFLTRGSSFLERPAIRHVAFLPRYPGEPERRVWDSKKDHVIYNNKRD